jgi:hypothetical protein
VEYLEKLHKLHKSRIEIMSKFDGGSEKGKESGDSSIFRGKRHPFLERNVDWRKIESSRYRSMDAGLTDSSDRTPEFAELELTGFDPAVERLERCVAAVRALNSNQEKWYVIRQCLIDEYREGGPERKKARGALLAFVRAVNSRLGSSGAIHVETLIGVLARRVAEAENVLKPELSAYITVKHSAGAMGPIGVCFRNAAEEG